MTQHVWDQLGDNTWSKTKHWNEVSAAPGQDVSRSWCSASVQNPHTSVTASVAVDPEQGMKIKGEWGSYPGRWPLTSWQAQSSGNWCTWECHSQSGQFQCCWKFSLPIMASTLGRGSMPSDLSGLVKRRVKSNSNNWTTVWSMTPSSALQVGWEESEPGSLLFSGSWMNP